MNEPISAVPQYGRFDVCILAGGLGTRLAGLWDGPKCLVPVDGVPLLERLLQQVVPLQPQRIVLATGHLSDELADWVNTNWPRLVPYHVTLRVSHGEPIGTAHALRIALPMLGSIVLVLNGDTLPRYDLRLLLRTASMVRYHPITAAWHDGRYAGAAVFHRAGLDALRESGSSDLDDLILAAAARYNATGGYIDVGTPEDFYQAQHTKMENL